MNKLLTKLLEYLVKQCTKEVLDQIAEEKLKVKFAKEKETEIPIKRKIPLTIGKDTKFKPKVKKLSEADEPQSPSAQPAAQPLAQPAAQPPQPEEPEQSDEPVEEPAPQPRGGPVLINPRDKSRLEPVRFSGRDERSIDRTLHDAASRIAGSKVKVSLGAKRLARESASNPNAKIYFYLGKMDPESEEIFLMADKSLQIAKNESIQPSEIQGSSVSTGTPSGEEHPTDDPSNPSSPFYFQSMTKGIRPKPRYGLSEKAENMIKRAVHQILDRK